MRALDDEFVTAGRGGRREIAEGPLGPGAVGHQRRRAPVTDAGIAVADRRWTKTVKAPETVWAAPVRQTRGAAESAQDLVPGS